jgi:ABC-type uncharacterized transport system substrate-binding protein
MTTAGRRAVAATATTRSLMLAVVILIAPLTAEAQPTGKVWRIGYLDQGSARQPASRRYLEALRQGLRDLGWVEGRNIAIEVRYAEGKTDQLPALAAELVRLKVDLIVTRTTPAALAAKQATTTIPGGNVTGWTHLGLELRAKYLELLKETTPKAHRFGVLWNPTNQVHRPSLKVIEAAAEQLRVELHLVGVQDPKELDSAFSVMVGRRVEALVVFPDGMFSAQAPLIIALAARIRLPTMYGDREFVEAGGLMAYGVNFADMNRHGASFVDKILKGAKPADLPVEQPTKFQLVINLKTAQALQLTIPQSVLRRADQVIE